MNTNTPYQAPQSQDTDTNQAAPALWNPNAAIAWSIPMALVSGALLNLLNNAASENFMFTPNIKLFLIFAHVFAAAIHMLNARAMGDTGLKRRNFGFILATPFVLAIIAPFPPSRCSPYSVHCSYPPYGMPQQGAGRPYW